jgi:hypothetical protein
MLELFEQEGHALVKLMKKVSLGHLIPLAFFLDNQIIIFKIKLNFERKNLLIIFTQT